MIDYDLKSGDAAVSGGDVQTVSSDAATRQRLEQKFNLWRGEWFLNINAGFPWRDRILGQRPRPEVVRSLVHDLVISDPGVRRVDSITLDFSGVDRRLLIQFSATLVSGEVASMEVEV